MRVADTAVVRDFFLFFTLQFVSYLNITIDYRAVAYKQYAVVAVCNVIAPLIAWVMVKKIGEKKNGHWAGMLAVALGGASASLLGIWLTNTWGG